MDDDDIRRELSAMTGERPWHTADGATVRTVERARLLYHAYRSIRTVAPFRDLDRLEQLAWCNAAEVYRSWILAPAGDAGGEPHPLTGVRSPRIDTTSQ